MNELEKIKAWEYLKTEIAKIHDPKTRSLYYRAFLSRCIDEWGFNPENPTSSQKNTVSVDDWEKDFVQDIQDTISYGIDTREEKRKKTLDETIASMRQFVSLGGKLPDIPDDIRTPYIEKLYTDALLRECDEWCQAADFLIQNGETKNESDRKCGFTTRDSGNCL